MVAQRYLVKQFLCSEYVYLPPATTTLLAPGKPTPLHRLPCLASLISFDLGVKGKTERPEWDVEGQSEQYCTVI
jgi:hypothetical protein